MYKNKKECNVVISSAVCIAILTVMFFSIFFIGSEVNHHCTGEDCPICAEMEDCVSILNSIGAVLGLGCFLAAGVIFITTVIALARDKHIAADTLVSLKVKLTN